MPRTKADIFGRTLQGLKDACAVAKLPAFTSEQIVDWLYKKHVRSFARMSNLAKTAREDMDRDFAIGVVPPECSSVSSDGAKKYLYRFDDVGSVETAFIPEANRGTLCISTQVGCRRACRFCMTGKQGFLGNLTAGQILNQYEALPDRESVTNIVYMGMGEPLDNLAPVLNSLEIFTASYGYSLSPRRITVSTVGIMPQLRRFLEATDCNIAISLHSPLPDERRTLMPVEASNPILDSLGYLKTQSFQRSRRVTFEYILFDGINDSERHSTALVRLLHGIRCRVNLIRYNAATDLEYSASRKSKEFRENLVRKGLITTIRNSRGADIDAACGLLSTKIRGE